MKSLVTIVAVAVLIVGLLLSGLSDTRISIADTSIPDNASTTSVSKASNSSASGVITITMYAVVKQLNKQVQGEIKEIINGKGASKQVDKGIGMFYGLDDIS